MSAFSLDTSGGVFNVPGAGIAGECWWPDLDPFTQGYIEAALRAYVDIALQWSDCPTLPGWDGTIHFSDLAPETLAAILKDCEGATERYRQAHKQPDELLGAYFWHDRQGGDHADFPPLTPYLGDDGKVRLRPAESGLGDGAGHGTASTLGNSGTNLKDQSQ